MTPPQPPGFLAVPRDTGRGVLVLHPWWGLNDTIKAFCTRLAEAGFIAFAPDLYHGQLATTIPEAERLSRALDVERARADIAAAVAFLRAASAGQTLAVVGFSLGAFFALELSTMAPETIDAVVVFYGTGPGDYTGSKAAYLGHFAANDPYEPEAEVNRLEAALRAAGRPVTICRYAGTGHWFFEPDRTDAYDAPAAALAWARTLAFLNDRRMSEDDKYR
ncbi:MAG: dienelactone hydrolase family protein [Anaerolineales bacterium]|nr:dienelactone hydrolase family protein [Anaerolineales bacterium]MCB8951623.1 dienelactone hydrolase family protein [Ardenticatenales bacterium]